MLDVVVSHKLAPADSNAKLEEVAVRAALSSGADVVLVQEQLGDKSSLVFDADDAAYSREQLAELIAVTQPLLEVS